METAELLGETTVTGQTTKISDYELERGKPLPSKRHAIIQTKLVVMLAGYNDRFQIATELNVVLGGKKYVPDICLYSADASDWAQEELEMTIPPVMTVEILSPSQDLKDLLTKAKDYLAHGVRSAWVVHPRLSAIIVLAPHAKPRFYSEGSLTDEATGVNVDVEAVFR